MFWLWGWGFSDELYLFLFCLFVILINVLFSWALGFLKDQGLVCFFLEVYLFCCCWNVKVRNVEMLCLDLLIFFGICGNSFVSAASVLVSVWKCSCFICWNVHIV